MKGKALLLCFILFSLSAFTRAQQWGKYIPEKQRKDIIKKSFKGTGVGGIFAGKAASVFWITDPMACAVVSNFIDRERLSSDEATTRYEALRANNIYTFLIDALQFRHLLSGVYGRKGDIPEAEMFLQRADNRKLFAKGELAQANIRLGIFNVNDANLLIARFPKTARTGEPLILDVGDKIEIQFTLGGKKVILEYKLKDLVSRLEDL
jgi:hypothetical protein